jgi:AcrR family transcriptional regulator
MVSPNTPERAPLTARGRHTRQRILISAEKEFGQRGFHAASVSSITQDADVGQGTFYIYFERKEEIFGTLVVSITDDLVQKLAQQAGWQSVAATLTALAAHSPGRDRILREAEFVNEPGWQNSRNRLVAAIAARLNEAHAQAKAALLLGGTSLVHQQGCVMPVLGG